MADTPTDATRMTPQRGIPLSSSTRLAPDLARTRQSSLSGNFIWLDGFLRALRSQAQIWRVVRAAGVGVL